MRRAWLRSIGESFQEILKWLPLSSNRHPGTSPVSPPFPALSVPIGPTLLPSPRLRSRRDVLGFLQDPASCYRSAASLLREFPLHRLHSGPPFRALRQSSEACPSTPQPSRKPPEGIEPPTGHLQSGCSASCATGD